MGRCCTVCTHEKRQEIDKALVTGATHREVSERFRLSPSAVYRHKQGHLAARLKRAFEASETRKAVDLVQHRDRGAGRRGRPGPRRGAAAPGDQRRPAWRSSRSPGRTGSTRSPSGPWTASTGRSSSGQAPRGAPGGRGPPGERPRRPRVAGAPGHRPPGAPALPGGPGGRRRGAHRCWLVTSPGTSPSAWTRPWSPTRWARPGPLAGAVPPAPRPADPPELLPPVGQVAR